MPFVNLIATSVKRGLFTTFIVLIALTSYQTPVKAQSPNLPYDLFENDECPAFDTRTITPTEGEPDSLLTQGIDALKAGDPATALNHLEGAVDGFDQVNGSKASLAQARIQLGFAYYNLCLYRLAEEQFGKAVNLYNNSVTDEPLLHARAYHQYARAMFKKNDKSDVSGLFAQAIKKAEAAKDKYELAAIYLHRGDVFYARQDYQSAIDDYAQASDSFSQAPDQQLAQAYALYKLGSAYWFVGNLALARQSYEQVAGLYNGLGFVVEEAQAYAQIAYTHHHAGDLYGAMPIYEKALALFQQANDPIGIARTHAAIGDVFHQMGFLAEAHSHLDQAEEGFKSQNDPLGKWLLLGYQGDILLTENKPDEALAKYNFISAEAPPAALFKKYYGLARTALRNGDKEGAEDYSEEARDTALGDSYDEQRIFILMALTQYAIGKTEGVGQVKKALENANDTRGEITALVEMARYQLNGGEYAKAQESYDEALSLVGELNDPLLTGSLYLKSGGLKEFMGNYAGALDDYSAADFAFEEIPETDPLMINQKQTLLADVLSQQAYIFYLQGHYDEAVTAAESSLDMLPDPTGELRNTALINQINGFNYFVLGQVYIYFEFWPDAVTHFGDAETSFDASEDQAYLAWVYGLQGNLAYRLGDESEANNRYGLASSTLDTLDRESTWDNPLTYLRARGIWRLGEANSETLSRTAPENAYGRVIEHYRNYRDLYGDKRGKAEAYLALASLYLKHHQEGNAPLKLARGWAVNGLTASQGDVLEEGRALQLVTQICIQQSLEDNGCDGTTAGDIVTSLETVVEKFIAADVPSEVIRAYEQLGYYHLTHASITPALEAFTEMRKTAQASGDRIQLASAYTYIGQTYEAQRQSELALFNYDNAACALTPEKYPDQACVNDVPDKGRFFNDVLFSRQSITTYAVWLLYDLNLDLIAAANIHHEDLQEALNAPDIHDSAQVLATLAQGEYLLMALRDPAQARTEFTDAQTLASALFYGEDLEAQAWLGVARSYTTQLLRDARGSSIEGEDDSSNVIDLVPGTPEYEAYRSALAKSRANALREADVYFTWADAYMQRNLFKIEGANANWDAQSLYSIAADKAKSLFDWSGQGYALLALGDGYLSIRDLVGAEDNFIEAKRLFEKSSDYIGQGEALTRLGRLEVQRGDFGQAITDYDLLTTVYGNAGDYVRDAYAQMLIGEVAYAQRRYTDVEIIYGNALETIRRYRTGAAQASDSQTAAAIPGFCNWQPNVFDGASDSMTQPLIDHYEVDILLNLAALSLDLGKYSNANGYIADAEGIAARIGDPFILARVDQSCARWLVMDQKEFKLAIPIFERANATYELYGDTQRLIVGYLDLGHAHYNYGLALADKTKSIYNEGEALRNYKAAVTAYAKALSASRSINNNGLIALSRYHYGKALILSRDSRGETQLKNALKEAESTKDKALQASVRTTLGAYYEEQNLSDPVLGGPAEIYTKSLDLIEDVYANLRNETGQSGFFVQNLTPYHRLVGLLALSNPEAAFDYAERGRARTFLFQFLSEQITLVDDGTGLYGEWQNLISQRILIDPTEENEIRALDAKINNAENRLIAQSQLFRQITSVKPSELPKIQEALPDKTAMLVYYIAPPEPTIRNDPGGVFLFVITKGDFEALKLDISVKDLDLKLSAIDTTISLDETRATTLNDLYKLLIPQHLISPEIDQLILVPHGRLNNVSFAMLKADDGQPLIQHFKLIYVPSATYFQLTVAEGRPAHALTNGLLLGDPGIKFVDGESLPALTHDEVDNLSSLFTTSHPLTGDNANEAVLQAEGQTADVIHISAHGIFKPSNPSDSFLVLSKDEHNDGHLTVREIYRLPLRQNAPLVVLSACDTGVLDTGSEQSTGQEDELQNLARGFLVAGASEVVATLWRVEEKSSVELMKQFYQNKKNNLDSATALQLAQDYVRNQPGWEAPKFWAGFILIGSSN